MRLSTIKMATKIENIIHHAIKTFQRPVRKPPEVFHSELSHLKTLVDDVTMADLNIPKYILRGNEGRSGVLSYFQTSRSNPVEYVPVYEDSDVTIGIFIVKQGARLPLHDHPAMYGFLKVVEGVLKVKSYSIINMTGSESGNAQRNQFYYDRPVTVRAHPEVVVTKKEDACVLTPTDHNIHEVMCLHGPAAFLDVLSPPYEDMPSSSARSCHYFEIVNSTPDTMVQLVQVPCPDNWMDA